MIHLVEMEKIARTVYAVFNTDDTPMHVARVEWEKILKCNIDEETMRLHFLNIYAITNVSKYLSFQ